MMNSNDDFWCFFFFFIYCFVDTKMMFPLPSKYHMHTSLTRINIGWEGLLNEKCVWVNQGLERYLALNTNGWLKIAKTAMPPSFCRYLHMTHTKENLDRCSVCCNIEH